MWITSVEIPNIFRSVLEVLGGLPGAVLHCPFVANPFHKILKFLAVEATIQDSRYLVLDFAIHFDQGRGRLLTMRNFVLDV